MLRFASLAILAVWVGGLAALGGVAAPAIFAVLEAQDPAGGRTLAGLLFGDVFQRFQHLAWAIGALLLVLTAARAVWDVRMRRARLRLAVIAAMLAMSVYTGAVLAPGIDRLRRDTAGAIASLSDSDPRKIEFGRLHGVSNGLMLATLVAGLALLWGEATE